MNQVQIRQMLRTPSTNTQRVAGSWFPTGYYGHFRAKPRADLCNYFRQLARPNPPKKFLDRQNSEVTSHMFSQHDNRYKFENDPLVRGTQMSFGKRKSQTNLRGEFDPFFISWIPKNIDRKKYIDDIKTTSYENDYNRDLTSSQILSSIQSFNSSSPSSELSVYSTVYSHGQPDNQQSKQIRQETFQRYSMSQTSRSQLQHNERSASVGSCLIWNNTDNENKTTPINDTKMNILMPNTLQPCINSNFTSTINRSRSMQMLKTMEQPCFRATIPREHYNVKVIPPLRAATSFEQTHTNSIECLISKYM